MTESRTSRDQPIDGALAVDKPSGPTSHDIVRSVRGFYRTRAGHTGTLDPLASGVLVLLLGKATRLARFLQQSDKTYRATVQLGVTTDTYDREGQATTRESRPDYSRQQVEGVLDGFKGELHQIPPMYSAVRLDGERLYERARRGEEIERAPRRVSIRCLELKEFSGSRLTVDVVCSAGTYIRVLAHEIGRALGCGACLWDLRRLRSGDFRLDEAVPIHELSESPARGFRALESLLPAFHRIDLQDVAALRARHGNPISLSGPSGYCRLFHNDALLAVARRTGDVVQPVVVFAHESD